MSKGKIKIRKNGSAEVKDGKKTHQVPKKFDLSDYTPESGSKTLDCIFELDENYTIYKLQIEEKEIGFKQEILDKEEKKNKREKQKSLIDKWNESQGKEYKAIKDFKKRNFSHASKSLLPKDTIEVLKNKEYLVDNFNLELNKLARYENGKFLFFKNSRRDVEFEPKVEFSKIPLQQMKLNAEQIASSLFCNTDNYYKISFKPNWRLIIGLGGESVYETSITLHHIYGIPYIPASSIKGVVRNYIINNVYDNDGLEFAEGRAIQDKDFCDIFGCPAVLEIKNKNKFESYYSKKFGKKMGNRKGIVTFLDAFPVTPPNIKVDIMNVHYPQYYKGNGMTPPNDKQDPNPIPFLTVENTDFQFFIGSLNESINEFKINNKSIKEWLIDALKMQGIGAKTAVGYGILDAIV